MDRPQRPAIALLELNSIARAHRTGDAMVKQASVQVALSTPISTGKYLILVSGGEAEVEESWRAGVADGGEAVVDQLYLPGVHAAVVDAIFGRSKRKSPEAALAVVETGTVTAAILACDAACKESRVELLDMRLGKGIGGKGVFLLGGELFELEASVAAAKRTLETRSCSLCVEIVPRPDPGFPGGLQ